MIIIIFIISIIKSSYAQGAISVDDFIEILAKKVGYTGEPPEKTPEMKTYIPEILDRKHIIKVHLKGIGDAINSLKVYDPTNRLMKGAKFTPEDYKDGFHKVGFYKIDKQRAICLKCKPEAPGLEIASDLLYRIICDANGLIGTALTSTIAIVMNGVVFSVSRYIEGDNLHEILRVKKNFQQYCFSLRQIMARIEWSILVNPEDFRPKNCILSPVKSSPDAVDHDIASIDNERVFGESYQETESTVTRVHSLVYCFPQMHDAIPKGSFCLPFAAMQEWLIKVSEEHRYQTALKEYVKSSSRKSILGVPITGPRLHEIYVKMVTIAVCIANGKTLMDVLENTNPSLAEVYKGMQPQDNSLESIIECLKVVDGGRIADSTPPSAGSITEYLGKKITSVFDDNKELRIFFKLLELAETPSIDRPKVSYKTTSCRQEAICYPTTVSKTNEKEFSCLDVMPSVNEGNRISEQFLGGEEEIYE